MALTGFALMGVALSVVFPLTLRAAGPIPRRSWRLVGHRDTGFLAGPPLIGLLAEPGDLRGALALAVGTCTVAVLLAPALREPGARTAPSER